MPRPVHFDLPADDPARAIAFYEQALGWKATKWEGPMDYWLFSTGDGPGIDGGLAHRQDPDHGIVNTLDVSSVDETVAKIEAAGGTIVSPKSAVPGVGWLAMCLDTEGNMFGIMEEDETAGIG